jgi:hypothetical protein
LGTVSGFNSRHASCRGSAKSRLAGEDKSASAWFNADAAFWFCPIVTVQTGQRFYQPLEIGADRNQIDS